jgi:hypothetical protein
MPSLSNDNNVDINITTNGDDSGIEKVNGSLGGMVENFSSGMKKVSLVTGVAAAGLTAYSKSSVNYLQGLVKDSKTLATQTGMTVEQSSQLTAVMGRLGINATASSTAFRTLSKQITDARDSSAGNALKTEELNNKIADSRLQINLLTAQMEKNGDATGAIKQKISDLTTDIKGYEQSLGDTTNTLTKLGINTQDAEGKSKSFDTVLGEVADKFKAMPNGAEKTADAISLFGRNGASMIKFLNEGSDGIAKLEDQAKKLGLTLTAQNIDTIAKYTKSQKDLADSTNSLKIQVGELTAPIMTKFNQELNKMLLKLIDVDSPFRTVTANVLAFGGPILGAVSGVAAFTGNVASALPLLEKMATAMKFEAAFGAINSLVTTVFPGMVRSLAITSSAWTAAFPIAGILLDIALVAKAIDTVLGAWRETEAAAKSAKEAGEAQDQTHATLLNLQKNGDAGQQQRATALLKKGYSTGGFTGTGASDEVAGVVHKGEYVIPKSGVDQQTGMPKSQDSGMSITIQNMIVQAPNNATVKSIMDSVNQDRLLASKNMTVRQGA